VAVQRAEREDPGLNLKTLNALERWVGPVGVFLTVIVLVVAIYAYFFGRSEAFSQETFFVTSGARPMVILEFEDDKLIAAPFDAECKSLTGTFVILPTSKTISIHEELIGPLDPAPCSPSA